VSSGISLVPLGPRWRTYTATANSAGIATVTTDTVGAGEHWDLDRMVVSVAGSSLTGTIDCYHGDPQFSAPFASAANGNSNTWVPDSGPEPLEAGEYVSAQWVGLSPGAVATLKIHYAAARIDVLLPDPTFLRRG
jgi:hypothetical protein